MAIYWKAIYTSLITLLENTQQRDSNDLLYNYIYFTQESVAHVHNFNFGSVLENLIMLLKNEKT